MFIGSGLSSRTALMNITLEKMYSVGEKFLLAVLPNEVYRSIVYEITKLVEAEYGSIFLKNEDGDLERVFTSVPLATQMEPRNNGSTWKAMRSQKTVVTSLREIKKTHPELHSLKINSIVIVPLSNNGVSMGALTLQSVHTGYFTPKKLQILKILGSLASLAIQRSQLYEQTKKAVETRDIFISMASHELKTPLTTITCYAELLKRKFSDTALPEVRWVEHISTETAFLTTLVNQLLRLNQIKHGDFSYSWKTSNLIDLIKRSVHHVQCNYPKANIQFINEVGVDTITIMCDEEKIMQVLINILGNAVKFSHAKDLVQIKLSDNNNAFTIAILDKGVGIAKEDLPRIFDGFYKGKDNYQEGMGLGLFLAKTIVQQHHGFLSIESKKGEGTQATVILPKNINNGTS